MKRYALATILLMLCSSTAYTRDPAKTNIEIKPTKNVKIAKNDGHLMHPATLVLPGRIVKDVTHKLQLKLEKDFQKQFEEMMP